MGWEELRVGGVGRQMMLVAVPVRVSLQMRCEVVARGLSSFAVSPSTLTRHSFLGSTRLSRMAANTNFLDVRYSFSSLSRSPFLSFLRSSSPPLRFTDHPVLNEQKACDIVKQAIDADVKQEWDQAFKLYKYVLSFSSPALSPSSHPILVKANCRSMDDTGTRSITSTWPTSVRCPPSCLPSSSAR